MFTVVDRFMLEVMLGILVFEFWIKPLLLDLNK